MPISLRIIGNFYSRSDIPIGGGTVKDVLDYCVQNPTGNLTSSSCDNFKYIAGQAADSQSSNPLPSVTGFFANYDSPVISLTSGIQYPPGEYFLPESLVDNPAYEVWQYYVFDAPLNQGGKFVPRDTPIQSYTEAKVDDGFSVVWRLVKILTRPNDAPAIYRRAFGLRPLTS